MSFSASARSIGEAEHAANTEGRQYNPPNRKYQPANRYAGCRSGLHQSIRRTPAFFELISGRSVTLPCPFSLQLPDPQLRLGSGFGHMGSHWQTNARMETWAVADAGVWIGAGPAVIPPLDGEGCDEGVAAGG